ncbi:MFS multidrug transporter [Phlyctema vagabunda]|uniref:MFS multidrug transporter n=1 Tax=Phlyctema vagabunda TaxID=108571 RepID=A0ABR4PEG6_9HELO
MHDRNNASEDSHLLPPPNSTVVATKLEFQAQHWLKIWHTWKVPILCYLFALLADCGDTIRTTPKTRLLEIIICRRYYAEQNPDIFNASLAVSALELPESLCKIADIQGELVTTKTWLKIGENLCGLILAIPFGALADKKGRNFVLMLGIVGQILSEVWILGVCYFSSAVPFGFIYFSILLKSSGGGAIMLSAMVHAILSDVVTPDRRAEAFFHLASTMLLTEILAPPLGSVLMQTWSVFTPLICGFPFELASLAVLSMIPNTIQLLQQHVSCHDGLAPDAPISSIDANHGRGSSSSFTRIKARIEKLSDPILQVWTLISRNRNILLVNISFLVTTLGRETLDFLVQYTSKRFGWSLAKVCAYFRFEIYHCLPNDCLYPSRRTT